MTKLLPLGRSGLFSLVDDDDFEIVRQFKWHTKSDQGYVIRQIHIKGGKGKITTNVRLHRAIMHAPDGASVDHINHDTLDNRRANLRLVTVSQNLQNRRSASSLSHTGVRGVRINRDCLKPYQAYLNIMGKRVYLGRYATLAEADEGAKAGRARLMPHSPEARQEIWR